MFVKNLKLYNYRNFCEIKLDFCEGLNLIVGRNASGKTNILESINVALKAKSFKTNSNSHLIRFGEDEARIVMEVNDDGYEDKIDITIKNDEKILNVNEAFVNTIKEYNEYFECIVFVPDDLKIIKESKSLRRKFLDESISGVDKTYKKTIKQYNQVLDERNKLIKNHRYNSYFNEQLKALNIQLSDFGSYIMHRRKSYVERLELIAKNICNTLSDDNDMLYLDNNFTVEYVEDMTNQKNTYYKALRDIIEKDLENRQTNLGIHRDDLDIMINDRPAKYFASQAQIRTAVLSMKLAQLDLSRFYNDRMPIILLDDVFSELDDYRINYIIKYIEDFQAFLTTSERSPEGLYTIRIGD
ncbi:DNA replication/repair protein RecF [uncultured Finegoldia sp.]|uniref:DNA replication/repair protein RecF n=1 Tax=uncultured Finegoldia sp. TaxID=328009 RepID=UPI00261F91E7|nr:DNA replication and repair protein RecF [uncultured Finegoldia sp.]